MDASNKIGGLVFSEFDISGLETVIASGDDNKIEERLKLTVKRLKDGCVPMDGKFLYLGEGVVYSLVDGQYKKIGCVYPNRSQDYEEAIDNVVTKGQIFKGILSRLFNYSKKHKQKGILILTQEEDISEIVRLILGGETDNGLYRPESKRPQGVQGYELGYYKSIPILLVTGKNGMNMQ